MPQRSYRNAIKNLSRKGIKQKFAGVGFIQSTALQVENFIGIQLAYRRPVRTFHLVSSDF
jgi:hypothetical protein